MRFFVVAIFAFVVLVFEQGLSTLIEVDQVTPSLLLVFAVFLALTAPLEAVPWLMLGLGALLDLSTFFRVAGTNEDFALLGPYALGFLASGYVTSQLRGMVFRDSAISVAAIVFITGIFAHLIVVAILTMRGLPVLTAERLDQWHWPDEMVRRFFVLLYSAAAAIPMAFILIRLEPLMGITSRNSGVPHRARRVV